jgi:hypothetical protein
VSTGILLYLQLESLELGKHEFSESIISCGYCLASQHFHDPNKCVGFVMRVVIANA